MGLLAILSITKAVAAQRAEFTHYESSPWERDWLDNQRAWADNECDVLATSRHRINALSSVRRAQMLNRMPRVNAPIPGGGAEDARVFSKMWYRRGDETFFEYIEPLVGILRDPLTMCNFSPAVEGVFDALEDNIQSKRYLLLQPSVESERRPPPVVACARRRLLFDLGASFYSAPDGYLRAWSGTKWFVERYEAFNVTFDQIYAFEYAQSAPSLIFNDIPLKVLARYSYYNIGVRTDKKSVWNFWNFVREVATVDDHVTVKLDIDSPGLEEAFMSQLKGSAELLRLVDEMAYEDHVDSLPMHFHWRTGNRRRMSDSYDDFLYLRRRGVRMHSWP